MNLPDKKSSLYQLKESRFPHLFFLFLLSVILASLFLLLKTAKAGAQAILPLTVAPARQELIVNPGEKTGITIKFFNRGETPVSGLVKVADFIVEDKEGTPIFIEGETPTIIGPSSISPRYSAAAWVELPYERMTIAAKDKVAVQATLTVPKDVAPGGRYFAIYFEPGGAIPPAGGLAGAPSILKEATSPISSRIAGLVYLRIAGPVKEDARLVRMTVPKFLEYGPIKINSEIINLGNYHLRPRGQIILSNLFGHEVDRQLLTEQNIFPEVSRLYENSLGQKWMLGKYQVRLLAAYGETGKALEGIAYLWVVPWRVITVLILALLIVILLIAGIFRRFRVHEEELEEQIEELKKKLKEKE